MRRAGRVRSIGDAGVGALAEALRENGALASLDLSSNTIGDAGASALADAYPPSPEHTEA